MKSRPERLAHLRQFRSQIVLIGGWVLIVYLFLANLLAIFQVYRINHEIVRLQQNILRLQAESQELQNLIAYLKTDSFREREARRKLNYRKEGEKVLVIPNPVALMPEAVSGEKEALPSTQNLPTYLKWWYYLFEK